MTESPTLQKATLVQPVVVQSARTADTLLPDTIWIEILQHIEAGGVIEVCSMGGGSVRRVGYFDNYEIAAKAIAEIDGRYEENIFVTLNPAKRELLGRASNRLRENSFKDKIERTKDHEILLDGWFLIDVDPRRASGISSTDEEKDKSVEVAQAVVNWLVEIGLPGECALTAFSGNGTYLLFRTPWFEPIEQHIERKKAALNFIADQFDTEEVVIDRTVYNPARLICALGTVKRKGDNTPDRPHRRSSIGSVGGANFDKATVQTLRPFDIYALIEPLLPKPEAVVAAKSKSGQASNAYTNGGFDIREYANLLSDKKETRRGFTYFTCPNCEGFQKLHVNEHTGAYSCWHVKAGTCNFEDLRAAVRRIAGIEPNQKGIETNKQLVKREMSQAALEKMRSKQAETWPQPKPLPDGLLPVPKLPESLIPAPFSGWVLDNRERLQVPLEFLATTAIVAAASVIGNRVRIRPKRFDDWTVTPNLWGGIIGRPGVMKSPAIDASLAPLRRLVKDAETEHAEAKKRWKFEKEAADIRKSAVREKMKQAAKRGHDLESFRAELIEDEPEEPHQRRYMVNDSTVEKFGELLNRNPNGLLIFRDELTGWLRSLDDEQHARDRAFYLEAWNGDGSFVYDRIGRGTLKIDCVTTSIFGGIQPSKLETYLRGALEFGDDDDGLMQRLQMLVYPDIMKEWINIDRWPNTEMKNHAFEIFKGLRDLGPEQIGAEKDDDGRWFLRFTDEAQKFFDDWYVDLNRALRNGEFEHPALESHFSKYKSLMPTLALVFYLIQVVEGTSEGFEGSAQVGAHCAELAAAWCTFLMAHAKRIYGIGISAHAIHARTLAKHLQATDLENGFTARDIYLLKGWSGLSSTKTTEQALDLLENLDWVDSVLISTGGRPKTVYCINPRIREVKL